MAENRIGTMAGEGKFASFTFPALINFYKFTGIPKFEDTFANQKLLKDTENWDIKEEKERDRRMAIALAFCAYLIIGVVLYLYKPVLLVILTIIFFAFLILYIMTTKQTLKKYRDNAPAEKPNKEKIYNSHLENVFNIIQNNYLNGFRVVRFDNWGFFFYSKLGCACIDLKTGEMVLYAKENIKDVLLEHVHLGTSTTGSAITTGGMVRNLLFDFHYIQYSDTDIDTDSIQHYEWRLDILTDFLEFPKLSFKFADNTKGEDEAKIIYGILKP